MIEITDLSKVYQTKKNSVCQALEHISLQLPDAGLVFLLGKSGSGKSTLLNLLGGLDSPTSGSIRVEGKELSRCSYRELTQYRNAHVGFVFQDHYLVGELTVYENVALAAELGKDPDKTAVLSALKKVGLSGYENRYPAELSGGERQRVAIARAIVKSPRMILADEPTGNLDRETAGEILSLLRSFSEDALVFVVSHNREDAQKYAHRVIELSDGKIVSDLTQREQKTDRQERPAPQKAPMSLSGVLRLSGWFLRRKVWTILLYAFIVTVIMVVMALSQTVASFDGDRIVRQEMEQTKTESLYVTKTLTEEQKTHIEKLGTVSDSFPELGASDMQMFRDAGYDGQIYEVLKYNLNLAQSTVSAGIATGIFADSPYILEPLGTLVVDEGFLTEKFGKVQYLAKAEEFHPTGVIITDYLADIILLSGQVSYAEDYSDLPGLYYWGNREESSYLPRGYINGVIYTGYRETYRELFARADTENMDALLADEGFAALVEDIHSRYGFCYSLNPDFRTDALETPAWELVWHYSLQLDDYKLYTASVPQIRKGSSYDLSLGDNEVLMELSAYNAIFGTDYVPATIDTFVPHSAKLRHYKYFDAEGQNALFTMDIRIVGLFVSGKNSMDGTLIAGDRVYKAFLQDHIYTTGLYFTGGSTLEPVIRVAKEQGFQKNRLVVESVQTMAKAVTVFVPVFRLMAGILCVAVVFILMSFATKMIRDKQTQIGILKSMGIGEPGLCAVFGTQILLIALGSCALSLVGYMALAGTANELLVRSLRELASGQMIPQLEFLAFDWGIAGQNCLLILLLSAVAFSVPMLRLRRLDPVKIIKARD